MKRVAECALPRRAMYGVGAGLGVLAGLANASSGLDVTLKPALFLSLLAALVATTVLHECVHGAASVLLGHRPLFGFKPPLVYITFAGSVPRGRFVLVALAPFVVLDLLFASLYALGLLRLFADFGLIVNTIGSMGDLWIAFKVIGLPRGALVQDTLAGFEAWVSG